MPPKAQVAPVRTKARRTLRPRPSFYWAQSLGSCSERAPSLCTHTLTITQATAAPRPRKSRQAAWATCSMITHSMKVCPQLQGAAVVMGPSMRLPLMRLRQLTLATSAPSTGVIPSQQAKHDAVSFRELSVCFVHFDHDERTTQRGSYKMPSQLFPRRQRIVVPLTTRVHSHHRP